MGTENRFVKQFYSIAQNTKSLQQRKPEKSNIAIYGPVIDTAPYVMLLMRADMYIRLFWLLCPK
jgi:hypothetical protein